MKADTSTTIPIKTPNLIFTDYHCKPENNIRMIWVKELLQSVLIYNKFLEQKLNSSFKFCQLSS